MRSMTALPIVLLVVLLASVAQALYDSSSPVQLLDDKTFNQKVIKNDGLWYVEFFAPWCGHCKSLTPEYEKAATHLKGIVNVAAVDATQSQQLAAKYGVQGYPTIKVFGADKRSPSDYSGARTAAGITADAISQVSKLVRSRQQGSKPKAAKKDKPKASKQESTKGNSGSGSRGSGESAGGGANGKVVKLTADNFDSTVLQSSEPWLVEFFAPWCGHCKALTKPWADAARQLEGSVNLGALDATQHESLAQRYGIKGFPTIKVFGSDKQSPTDYMGERTAEAIVAEGLRLFEATGGATAVTQLSSSKVLSDKCKSRGDLPKLCVVAVLPHIIDGGAAAREGYLATVSGAAKKVRSSLCSYLWSEAGAQSSFEESFGLTFGYPALVAFSLDKGAYAVHVGAFDEAGIASFLTGITTGSTKTAKFSEKPRISEVPEWDGKDVQLVEEEMSLEDLFGSEEL